MNPWTTIPLDDYESHMAFPAVGQAAMLAREFGRAIAATKPNTVALLGCAGGNGLEHAITANLDKVICVDINPDYIAALKHRYASQIKSLECHACEVEAVRTPSKADLVFGGLIFEYTRLAEAIETVSLLLSEGGDFFALLQSPAPGVSTVSLSPYAQSLSGIVGVFQYIDPAVMVRLSAAKGMGLIEQHQITQDCGKSFTVVRLRKVETR